MDITWYRLRQSRSAPPGLAASSEARQLTYSSALGQFEELIKAAREASPATSPLPLYYAVSQAGKAIAAARATEPIAPGHGLTAKKGPTIVDTTVSPSRVQEYQGVAKVVCSAELPAETPLGALWASLPELGGTDMPDENWPRPLALRSLEDTGYSMRATGSSVRAAATVLGDVPLAPEHLSNLAAFYPTMKDAIVVDPADWTTIEHEFFKAGPDLVVQWQAPGETHDDRLRLLDSVAPKESELGRRMLRPSLPGGPAPTLLMTWWALLYGLSVLARYHPASWTEWLRVESSRYAIPVEDLLEEAIEHIPRLVYQAILGDGAGPGTPKLF